MNSTALPLTFHGTLPPHAIDLLAGLLIAASTSCDCEICCQRPKQELIEQGEYAGRYVCARCFADHGEESSTYE